MRNLKASLAMAFLLALPACSGMTSAEKGAVAGAAVGGVAGSALTGGSTLGTVGGAVGPSSVTNSANAVVVVVRWLSRAQGTLPPFG